jgi:O-acetyl-ADP-ribose deacetylase (regulator of RNase III)
MINTIKGNVLDVENTVIVHCVNCQGVMGSGIAREIRERYPSAYELYRKIYEQGLLQLGSVSYAEVEGNRIIANAAGQDHYGHDKVHVDYDATRYCFAQINSYMEQFFYPDLKIDTVSFPLFGCGLAGGDWNIVSKIIDEELSDKWKKNLYVL